jgi:16S rRNA (guanine527-N7)-methyltransferase
MLNFHSDIISLLPTNFSQKIEDFERLLLKWNSKINLISKSSEKDILYRHILDSVQLIKYIDKEKKVIDLGSGGGFPGIILSYAGVKNITLVESNRKKCAFLLQASLLSDFTIKIRSERCEDIKDLQGDIITARGFASIKDILALSTNLRTNSTEYLLLKGKSADIEIMDAKKEWKCSTWNISSITDNESQIVQIRNVMRKAEKD